MPLLQVAGAKRCVYIRCVFITGVWLLHRCVYIRGVFITGGWCKEVFVYLRYLYYRCVVFAQVCVY